MKALNVGCGNQPLEDFYNIDKYYYPGCDNKNLNVKLAMEFDGIWEYGDAAKLEYESEYFNEVICVHTLEHLSMDDGNLAIQEMARVLRPGGTCEIEVPDLEKACKLLQIYPFKPNGDNARWLRAMGLLYGTTGQDGEGQFHLTGYSKKYLKFKMEQHDFIDIEEIEVGMGHGKPEPEYNFRLKGIKK